MRQNLLHHGRQRHLVKPVHRAPLRLCHPVRHAGCRGVGGGDFDFWTVGLEGQLYMARTTLDGAVSYSEGDDADAELTAADVGLTHFFTDNFSVGGSAGFGNIDTGAGDGDATTFGLNAEWQFASAPISIFGGWQHVEIDDIDSDADTLGVGVRYNWGGSLIDRNRSGAGLARRGGLISRVLGAI